MAGLPPNRRCQKLWLSTTTASRSASHRPRAERAAERRRTPSIVEVVAADHLAEHALRIAAVAQFIGASE
jgi:hypothetical protein